MDVADWRSVSQHYVRDMIVRAVTEQHIADNYRPTLLIAASEDALAVARIVRGELKARMATAPAAAGTPVVLPILTQQLQLHDEETNPYNVHVTPWTGGFSGQRVLLVDKADNSRTSIAAFCTHLLGVFAEEKAQAQAEQWVEPQIGVFVLHNKRRPKAAELPPEVMDAHRLFIGEDVDNVQIAYPFNIHDHNTQPQAHGVHASGTGHAVLKPDGMVRRTSTPPPGSAAVATLRAMSTHYIETILESTVDKQQLMERFPPTMLVAASDDALPAARLLRHYLRHLMHSRQQQQEQGQQQNGQQQNGQQQAPELPLLTPRLELYDEDLNPYLAHIKGTTEWGAASLAGQRVLVVDRVDSSRMTLSTFIAQLQAGAAQAREAAQGEGKAWAGEPVFGVFVLHNKKVDKHADLPKDILESRYFSCEESEDVLIKYPFASK